MEGSNYVEALTVIEQLLFICHKVWVFGLSRYHEEKCVLTMPKFARIDACQVITFQVSSKGEMLCMSDAGRWMTWVRKGELRKYQPFL
jgi:hypothetical protein